jgi:hypothetical protein
VLPAGHGLDVEVTQNDAPHLRLDNLPSQITYSAIGLTLPSPYAAAPGGNLVDVTPRELVPALPNTGRAAA